MDWLKTPQRELRRKLNSMKKYRDPATLWAGMYGITTTLFYIETGSIATGLIMGLASATLKTAWGIVHKNYVAKDDKCKCND